MAEIHRPNFSGGSVEHQKTTSGGNGGGDLEARVGKLEASVEHIQSDVTEIKADVREIKNDVSGIKVEMASIRGDLNTETAKLRTEIQSSANKTMGVMIILSGLIVGAIKYL